MRWLWVPAAVVAAAVALVWIGWTERAPKPRSGDRTLGDYTIAGRVVDGAGRPVGNADVRLGQVESCMVRAAARDTKAGRDGAFAFEGVTMGVCTVRAVAPGYAATSVAVPSGETGLEVVLRRPASIEGLVVDEGGMPVAARLYRLSDGLMMPVGGYDWDDVDASGRFRYEGRLPGEFRLRAVTSDGREGNLALDVKEGDVLRDMSIPVASPWRSQVRLRARVAEGVPAKVFFPRHGDARVEWQGDVATLLFRDPPGTSVSLCVMESVHADEEGRSADCVLTTAPTTDLAIVEVRLPELVPVRVEADPPGARPSADFSCHDLPVSRKEGTPFRLSPACAYEVKVSAKGFVPVEIWDWRPPADGGVLSVRVKPASTIKGTVVDAQGAPVAGARVYLGDEESGAKTGSDGRFVLDTLPDGEHVVIASLEYRKVADLKVRTQPGETTDAGTLVARPRRTIRGRVIDERGRPVGGARVKFVSVLRSERYPESMYDSEETYSQADGSYEFEVAGVDGFLLVEKKGYGTTPAALAPAHEIVLPRPAFVRVDATREAKEDGVAWICSIRWPDLVPEAVWDVGMWLPYTVEVAAGRIEVIGNFDQYPMSGLKARIAGKRGRTIEVAQGVTAEVTFER